ncbi:ExbD/TolR family protein [Pseudoponticoccus marisrubri]|uniref:Indolepyruvate ferredoxin oxidoreductase n=1 Tax=Pseudoponticoccus marisrubri TaxID=1685382 RepID=A0A0W7WL31_9RHOB|nr:biopolymer transporter ExbD [Pseudoponticoccus marisrubri]KUF11238.1 indolepyruvate ferredoxin oxidoreductase [Pseudoponticoccus marisrubri]
MLDLPASPRRRRPSLTPMIDVVFLLLVFFMLAARFGLPLSQPLTLPEAGSASDYRGPPRLVEIGPDSLQLNGRPVTDLPAALAELMRDNRDIVVLRARDGADVQRLSDVIDLLSAAGLTRIALVE